MKIFGLLVLLICVSCSKKKETSSSKNLSTHQLKAQSLLKAQVEDLNKSGYDISQDEIDLLKKEDLVTDQELTKLSIVQ